MKINIQQEDNYIEIGFDGAIDLSTSSDARKNIIDVLEKNKNILIDLSLVTYIDSSGVASLVEGYQIAKKQSLKFGLIGVSDAAMSVLKLARLDQVFPIYKRRLMWDKYAKKLLNNDQNKTKKGVSSRNTANGRSYINNW